jgi:hypothetical protein
MITIFPAKPLVRLAPKMRETKSQISCHKPQPQKERIRVRQDDRSARRGKTKIYTSKGFIVKD